MPSPTPVAEPPAGTTPAPADAAPAAVRPAAVAPPPPTAAAPTPAPATSTAPALAARPDPTDLPDDDAPPEPLARDATVDPGALWHRLIEAVGRVPGQGRLHLAMHELKAVSFRQGILDVAYDDDVPPDCIATVQQAAAVEVLQTCFRRLRPEPGAKVLIKRWIESVSNTESRPRLVSSPEIRRRVEQNPFVQEVCRLFGGTVVDARG